MLGADNYRGWLTISTLSWVSSRHLVPKGVEVEVEGDNPLVTSQQQIITMYKTTIWNSNDVGLYNKSLSWMRSPLSVENSFSQTLLYVYVRPPPYSKVSASIKGTSFFFCVSPSLASSSPDSRPSPPCTDEHGLSQVASTSSSLSKDKHEQAARKKEAGKAHSGNGAGICCASDAPIQKPLPLLKNQVVILVMSFTHPYPLNT